MRYSVYINKRGEEIPRSLQHGVITLALGTERYPAHLDFLKMHCSFFEVGIVDFETVVSLPDTMTPAGLDYMLCFCYGVEPHVSSLEDILDAIHICDFFGGSRDLLSDANTRLIQFMQRSPTLSASEEDALESCLQKFPKLRESLHVVRKAKEHNMYGILGTPRWKIMQERMPYVLPHDVDQWTNKQLHAKAAEHDLATKKRMTKSELIKVLKDYEAVNAKKVVLDLCLVSDAVRKGALEDIQDIHEDIQTLTLPPETFYYRMAASGKITQHRVEDYNSSWSGVYPLDHPVYRADAVLPEQLGKVLMREIKNKILRRSLVWTIDDEDYYIESTHLENVIFARKLLDDMFNFSDSSGILRYIDQKVV